MFKIGFVLRSWGEERRPRLGGRGQGGQGRAQSTEKKRQAVDLSVSVQAGQNPRQHQSIFQGVAGSGRGLRPVVQHSDGATGSPGQVGRVQTQIRGRRGQRRVTGAQKAGMAIDQLGRQQAVANEVLWTIQVRADETEQFRPLDEALFDGPPLLAAEEGGYDVERPGSGASLGIGIDVIGHAVFAQDLLDFVPPPTQFRRAQRIESAQGVLPVGSDRAWG